MISNKDKLLQSVKVEDKVTNGLNFSDISADDFKPTSVKHKPITKESLLGACNSEETPQELNNQGFNGLFSEQFIQKQKIPQQESQEKPKEIVPKNKQKPLQELEQQKDQEIADISDFFKHENNELHIDTPIEASEQNGKVQESKNNEIKYKKPIDNIKKVEQSNQIEQNQKEDIHVQRHQGRPKMTQEQINKYRKEHQSKEVNNHEIKHENIEEKQLHSNVFPQKNINNQLNTKDDELEMPKQDDGMNDLKKELSLNIIKTLRENSDNINGLSKSALIPIWDYIESCIR
jgi:hypothetical protein